jgi:uncharacterized membrane protein
MPNLILSHIVSQPHKIIFASVNKIPAVLNIHNSYYRIAAHYFPVRHTTMKFNAGRAVFVCFAIFILLLNIAVAQETDFQIESTELQVYRDGLVRVTQTLFVNETVPEVTLQLLSSSVDNVLVLDENQTFLDYEVDGTDLTVLTFGATSVTLQYDTVSLTRKDFDVWSLIVDTSYNLTVLLPEDSAVIYLSDTPTSIDTEEDTINMTLFPSQWEISYVFPLIPPETSNEPTSNEPTSSEPTEGGSSNEPPTSDGVISHTFPVEILVAAAVAAVSILVAVFVLLRRKRFNVETIFRAHPQLIQEEKDVIRFLAEKEGKAFEAEIRERFPDIPRTSLWRLVRRLEKLEIVRVKKIGLENRVELKK